MVASEVPFDFSILMAMSISAHASSVLKGILDSDNVFEASMRKVSISLIGYLYHAIKLKSSWG